jgi:uncharacterized protein
MKYHSEMNRRLFSIFIIGFLTLFTFSVNAQRFPENPKPVHLVVDEAYVLAGFERTNLENKLVAFDDSSSNQIAVVIIKSLEGYDIASYSFALAKKWGIGQADKDNGVLVLVAHEDKKMFIATGYGLEGAIPDAIAKRIVENYMKPAFRQNNFYKGLDEATTVLMGLASGEFNENDLRGNEGKAGVPIAVLLVIGIFFLMRYLNYKTYKKQQVGGLEISFLAFLLLNSGRRGSGYGHFSGGTGSFSSNSGFGGGGGGGFGGFGGGGFGGGGAGGSW